MTACIALGALMAGAPGASAAGVTGPNRVKPGTTVTYEAVDFPPNTQLQVLLRANVGDCECGRELKEFLTDASGHATLRFKWARRYYFSYLTPRLGSARWKKGDRFEVIAWDGADARAERAGRIGPKQGGGDELPVKRIPVNAGKGTLTIECPLATACEGTVEITGKKKAALVKRTRYSVPAGGADKVKLKLTKAGAKAVRNRDSVRGTGLLTANSGEQAKFTAILERN